jgi:asparagine synthase (glutamine-hydrolysing)
MLMELADALEAAIAETLEDKVGVAFSGGVDSTLIAHIAKKYSQVELYSAGTPGSEDLRFAEKVAEELGLPLFKKELNEGQVLDYYAVAYSVSQGDLLRVELLVPACAVGEIAKERGAGVVLFGSGSEELFVGYERYYTYLREGLDVNDILKKEFEGLKQREIGDTKRLMRRYGVEARFPYYNRKLADMMFSVPLEQKMEDKELKKGMLREAAHFLGVPETAVKRKKRALQYGSGVHKILLKNSRFLNTNYPAKASPP